MADDPCYGQGYGQKAQRLGDAPLDTQLYAELARALDRQLNGKRRGRDRRLGFCLMIYPLGDHSGRCNYVSNGADRRDVVMLMKEMIRRFEGQPEMQGRA